MTEKAAPSRRITAWWRETPKLGSPPPREITSSSGCQFWATSARPTFVTSSRTEKRVVSPKTMLIVGTAVAAKGVALTGNSASTGSGGAAEGAGGGADGAGAEVVVAAGSGVPHCSQ